MKFIDSPPQLDEALKKIDNAERLALDTEADSLHHYYEKLCLLQISVPGEDYVIDSLAGLNLKKLMEILQQKPLICHGADFDLRMLKKFCDFRPKEVFDTMLAAQFLGYSRLSLAGLVDEHFKVHLSKKAQKADWSRRPLTQELLEYASNDTHYLLRMRSLLTKELNAQGRLSWLEESCHALIAATGRVREVHPESLWRIKGYKALKGKELVFLKELWHWREKEAQRKDKPRFKVLSSEQLLKMARWFSAHPQKPVHVCPHLPKSMKGSKVVSLEKVVKKASEISPETLQEPERQKTGKRFSNREKAILDSLKKERKALAEELKCDSSLIASNAVLERLVREYPSNIEELRSLKLLLEWQMNLVAERFLGILHGRGKS